MSFWYKANNIIFDSLFFQTPSHPALNVQALGIPGFGQTSAGVNSGFWVQSKPQQASFQG